MALSTKKVNANDTVNSKRSIILALADYHKELFEKEGVQFPKFIPRLCYNGPQGNKVISFYAREIHGGMDIYVEFCDRNYVPEDPERTLWKWPYNPHYETEYQLSEAHPATQDRRYLIPVDELVNVTELYKQVAQLEDTILESDQEEIQLSVDSLDTGLDVPYEAMTLRDYAAITWKKPVSYKPWLNELITKTFA